MRSMFDTAATGIAPSFCQPQAQIMLNGIGTVSTGLGPYLALFDTVATGRDPYSLQHQPFLLKRCILSCLLATGLPISVADPAATGLAPQLFRPFSYASASLVQML